MSNIGTGAVGGAIATLVCSYYARKHGVSFDIAEVGAITVVSQAATSGLQSLWVVLAQRWKLRSELTDDETSV